NPSYGIPISVPTTVTQSYRQKYNQTGLYAQDQIKFNDNWIITLGGRYDWLDLNSHNRLDSSDTDQNIGKFRARGYHLCDAMGHRALCQLFGILRAQSRHG
ncbi:TonB-dependent receptor, partial [Escherichia coli]